MQHCSDDIGSMYKLYNHMKYTIVGLCGGFKPNCPLAIANEFVYTNLSFKKYSYTLYLVPFSSTYKHTNSYTV